MKNILIYCIFVVFCCLVSIQQSYAQVASSSELINNAKQFDGKLVTYQGEVVGDIMIRNDYAWVNLNDGYAAIGIWERKAELGNINHLGSYYVKGDIVEVIGIFNRSCKEHGGDLDIHARGIKKVSEGGLTFHRLSMKKFNIGIFSTLGLLFFYFLNKFFRNKIK